MHVEKDRSTAIVVAGVLVVAGAIIRLGPWTATRRSLLRLRHKRRGFELLIRATFNTPDDLKVFKQHWRKLADHCKAHEPETLSYELLQSDKQSNEILIYERYTNKEALTEIHQQSEPFRQFGQRIKDLGIEFEKSGMSYLESGLGYI